MQDSGCQVAHNELPTTTAVHRRLLLLPSETDYFLSREPVYAACQMDCAYIHP